MTEDDWSIPDWLNVSRETHERLRAFYRLVCKWNAAINLVSAASLQDGWHRHVLDSAQLLALSDCDQGLWLDVGSGAGFHVALPSKAMCTDNAAMIASAGWYRLRDHGPSGLGIGAIPHLSLTGSTVRGNRGERK
jgi:hypothetical protein